MYAGGVAGLHTAERDRRLSGNKVAHQLRWRAIGAAAQLVRLTLPLPLKVDARERIAGVILRRDADHDARIRVAFVA